MNTLTQWMRGRSELLVALFLLAIGAVILVDASRLHAGLGQQTTVGPAAAPVVVGVLLVVVAAGLALDVLRGGRGDAEGGEDVDLSHPADWPTVLLLAGTFLVNVLLIERLGWPISGALLFFGCSYSLGSRRLVRNLAVSFALSFGTYFVFAEGLGVYLPPGVLEGVI
jgi:putative tricarboxylic transport membrane protein